MCISDEIKKKASAWFHITYEPWRTYVRKNRELNKNKPKRASNHEKEKQLEGFKELFSFAWIVYPVLFEIFDINNRDSTIANQSKKKKQKNKRNDPTAKNNKN